jgi:hypothetical protein
MSTAVLSFRLAGTVTFRSDELGLDERRDLETDTPFAMWSEVYAARDGGPAALLD